MRRKSGDTVGAGLESDGMGSVFLYQGRYGAAVKALQDAVTTFETAKDRSSTMAEILNDYSQALVAAGRGEEADKPLDEAESIAKEIKNDSLIASSLNNRAQIRLYAGDFNGAKTLFQQALQTATRSKTEDQILWAKLGLAKVAIAQGQSQSVAPQLRQLVTQADAGGFKYLSMQASVCLAETSIAARDYPRAQQQLDQLLGNSEKLGLRCNPRAFISCSRKPFASKATPDEAKPLYRQVVGQLDQMKSEPGAEKLLNRVDLKSMYDQATRASSTS